MIVFLQYHYIGDSFITIPRYNDVILPVPWYIDISGFHCSWMHKVRKGGSSDLPVPLPLPLKSVYLVCCTCSFSGIVHSWIANDECCYSIPCSSSKDSWSESHGNDNLEFNEEKKSTFSDIVTITRKRPVNAVSSASVSTTFLVLPNFQSCYHR